MAEETENSNDEALEDGQEAEEGGLNMKKIIMFVVLPLLIIGGGGAAAYFTGALDSLTGKEMECGTVKEGDEDFSKCMEAGLIVIDESKPGEFLEIPSLIVNLNSPGQQPRFLKISIKLELKNEKDKVKMSNILPRVVDQFQTYLRELRTDDLRGSSGIYRLREELLARVTAAAPDIDVKDVLFQEVLIQ